MKLESKDGSSFEISIVGYSFPETEDPKSRLVAKYSLTTLYGTWTATKNYILPGDILEIAEWLERRGSGRKHAPWLEHLSSGREYVEEVYPKAFDYDVMFKFTQDKTGKDVLRINLDFDDRYPDTCVQISVDFKFQEVDLNAAAQNLKAQLAKLSKHPQD